MWKKGNIDIYVIKEKNKTKDVDPKLVFFLYLLIIVFVLLIIVFVLLIIVSVLLIIVFVLLVFFYIVVCGWGTKFVFFLLSFLY